MMVTSMGTILLLVVLTVPAMVMVAVRVLAVRVLMRMLVFMVTPRLMWVLMFMYMVAAAAT